MRASKEKKTDQQRLIQFILRNKNLMSWFRFHNIASIYGHRLARSTYDDLEHWFSLVAPAGFPFLKETSDV